MATKKNPGKVFEGDIKDSFAENNIFCMRINDNYMANVQVGKGKYTTRNPADYIFFNEGKLYFAECKSTKYKSMSFSLDPMDNGSPMIKAHQIDTLMSFSDYEGIRCGFLLNFRDEVAPANTLTYWLPIEGFSLFLSKTDKKSINKLDIVENGGILINAQVKRTHLRFDIPQMFKDIDEYYQTHKHTNIKEIMTEFREQQASSIEDAMDAFVGG